MQRKQTGLMGVYFLHKEEECHEGRRTERKNLRQAGRGVLQTIAKMFSFIVRQREAIGKSKEGTARI